MEFYDFWKEHSQKVVEELQKKGTKTEICPYCEKNAFDTSKNVCSLCGHDDSQIRCHLCKKTIWRGEANEIELPTDKTTDYGPILDLFPVCEKCYDEVMAEEMVDGLIEDRIYK